MNEDLEQQVEPTIDLPPVEQLRAFIGKNADYYITSWKAMTDSRLPRAGFNTAAFLMHVPWLLYRKMWRHWIIIAALLAIAGQIGKPVAQVVGMAITIVSGLYANRLYFNHAMRRIAHITATAGDDKDLLLLLRKKGGTSVLVPSAVFVISLVFLVARLQPLLHTARVAAGTTRWQKYYVPGRREITRLAGIGSTVFAGMKYGGLYVSRDSGAHWSPVQTGIPNDESITCVTTDGTTLFAGTPSSGVIVSTDGGMTWTGGHESLPVFAEDPINGLPSRTIRSLLCTNTGGMDAFNTTHLLLAATDKALAVSQDNAASWNDIPLDEAVPDVRCLLQANTSIFAATSNGIYRSDDAGAHWRKHNSGLANLNIQSLASDNRCIYAATSKKLFRSSDNGEHWNDVRIDAKSTSEHFMNAITALVAKDGALLLGRVDGLYTSTDQGLHWSRQTQDGGNSLASLVSITDVDNTLYAGTANGVLTSSDNGWHWKNSSDGIETASRINAMVANDTELVVATSYGLFSASTLQHDSSRWKTLSSSIGKESFSTFATIDTVLMCGGSSGVYLRGPAGALTLAAAPPRGEINALVAMDSLVFAGTNEGLFVTRDTAKHWNAVENCGDSEIVLSLVQSDNLLFAGTQNHGVFVSHDAGSTWEPSGIYPDALEAPVHAMAAAGPLTFAGTDNGVFVLHDNGEHWVNMASGVEFGTIRGIIVNGPKLYLASSVGVAVIDATKSAPVAALNDFPEKGASALAIVGEYLYVGGSDVYRMKLTKKK